MLVACGSAPMLPGFNGSRTNWKQLNNVNLGQRKRSVSSVLGVVALVIMLAGLLHTTLARTTRNRALAHSRTYTVTATAYEAVAGQTDSKPFITADNSRIPRGYGSHTRWLALSRDLLRPWGGPFEFGEKVRVRGVSPRFDGVYTIHDTMHRRYRHRLDLLVHPREHVTLYQPGVQLESVSNPESSLPSIQASAKSLRREHRATRSAGRSKHAAPTKKPVSTAKKATTRAERHARKHKAPTPPKATTRKPKAKTKARDERRKPLPIRVAKATAANSSRTSLAKRAKRRR